MSKHQPITRGNYETFLVDYWDGQLSPAQTELLMRFLEENPDLKQLAEGAEDFSVSSIAVSFDEKATLRKKEVNENSIDDFLVAELEGELMPHQENELKRFLAAFPAYEKDRKLYALTRVKADTSLVFPFKRALKKGVLVPLWIQYSSVAAAACIILALSVWNLNPAGPGNTQDLALSSTMDIVPAENGNKAASVTPVPAPVKTQKTQIYTASVVTPNHSTKKEQNHIPSTHTPSSRNDISVPVITTTDGDNFSSYSKTRRPDDYSEALAGNYTQPVPGNESNESLQPVLKKSDRSAARSVKRKLSQFTSFALERVITDPSFTRQIDDDALSPKLKVAAALAFATGKASNGKVKVETIPDDDGSLAAMSFRSGKYNYTKKF